MIHYTYILIQIKILIIKQKYNNILMKYSITGNKFKSIKKNPIKKTQYSKINILKKIGIQIEQKKSSISIKRGKRLKKISLVTKPYPGFPTDLQAQLMVLMIRANGISRIKENIFENRFMHVPELKRMGANIKLKGSKLKIIGVEELLGAEVMATDLRASVSLVLAGLIADNRTSVNRIYHLDRGYQDIEKKLKACKADIKRL